MEVDKLLRSRVEQLESKRPNVERAQATTPSLNQDNLFLEFIGRQSIGLEV